MEDKKPNHQTFFDKLKQHFRQNFAPSFKGLRYMWLHKQLLLFPVLTINLVIGSAYSIDAINYRISGKHIFSRANKTLESSQAKSKPGRRGRGHLPFEIIMLTFLSIIFSCFSNVAFSRTLTLVFQNKPARIIANSIFAVLRFPIIFCSSLLIFFVSFFSLGKRNDIESEQRRNWFQKKYNLPGEFGWSIATFLTAPIIAHEKQSITNNIRRSSELMNNNFDGNVKSFTVFNFINRVFYVGSLLIGGIIFGLVLLVDKILNIPFIVDFGGYTALSIGAFAAILACFFSSAATVFKTAVYHFTQGNLIGPFDENEIKETLLR